MHNSQTLDISFFERIKLFFSLQHIPYFFYLKFLVTTVVSFVWASVFFVCLANSILRDKPQSLRNSLSVSLILFFLVASAVCQIAEIPHANLEGSKAVSNGLVVSLRSIRASALVVLIGVFFWKTVKNARRTSFVNSQSSTWFVGVSIFVLCMLLLFGPDSRGTKLNSTWKQKINQMNLTFVTNGSSAELQKAFLLQQFSDSIVLDHFGASFTASHNQTVPFSQCTGSITDAWISTTLRTYALALTFLPSDLVLSIFPESLCGLSIHSLRRHSQSLVQQLSNVETSKILNQTNHKIIVLIPWTGAAANMEIEYLKSQLQENEDQLGDKVPIQMSDFFSKTLSFPQGNLVSIHDYCSSNQLQNERDCANAHTFVNSKLLPSWIKNPFGIQTW
jgi:hypothetical protein